MLLTNWMFGYVALVETGMITRWNSGKEQQSHPHCIRQSGNGLYECSMQNNPIFFALKGKNALGTEFFVSFQERMFNMSQSSWQEPAYSAFEIAFTEDNTYITLEIPPGKQIYNGSNPPLTGTVVLGPFHRGESYSGAPAIRKYAPYIPKTGYYSWDKYFGRVGADHLNGVRITTNGKKIAVTLKDTP
jgi:hypothetical protein